MAGKFTDSILTKQMPCFKNFAGLSEVMAVIFDLYSCNACEQPPGNTNSLILITKQ